MPRIKNTLHNLFLLVVVLIIFFILFEFVLRFYSPITPYAYPKNFFMNDYLIDYKLTPNFKGRIKTSEYTTNLFINSQGFRNSRDYNPNNPSNIILLGDSFTFGVGVDKQDNFATVLENILNKEIVNTGVPGYGTDNEYYTYKNLNYNHSLVILMISPNDVFDNLERFENVVYKGHSVSKARLESSNKLIFTMHRFLKLNFMSYTLIYNSIYNILHKDKFSTEAELYLKKNSANYIKGMFKTHDYLSKIKKSADKFNSKLLIVTICTKYQLNSPEIARYSKFKNLQDSDWHLRKINNNLKEFSEQNNLFFYDLCDDFSKLNKPLDYFYVRDGHWNKKGCRLVASLIHERLINENLVSISQEIIEVKYGFSS